jgi:hypothetical protein
MITTVKTEKSYNCPENIRIIGRDLIGTNGNGECRMMSGEKKNAMILS